ncbi:MAG TPA: HEAT repeat domain-containing protein [Candidatus Ozemobacteraceae bacterium]|nr:HEAT repeat domain-containing protein [Candidatus Ozemobacteraceae bacterium]
MPAIDVVILGFFAVLVAIIVIRVILHWRAARKARPAPAPVPDGEQPQVWPKAFEPPKRPEPAGDEAADASEPTPGSLPTQEMPGPSGEAQTAPADEQAPKAQVQMPPLTEDSALPGKPNVQLPPAKIAGPEELITIMGNFSSPLSERFEAIRRSADLMLNDAVPTLVEILYEPDLGLSAAAAEALGKIGDPRGIEPLMDITHRNDVRLLQEIRASGYVPPGEGPAEAASAADGALSASTALEVVQEANPFKYRELTVFKIDLLPKEYFQPDGTPIPRRELVMKGLKDNDQQLRKMAAKAAIGLNDPDVIPTLVETLGNPYEVESVRYLAAEALGDAGDDRGSAPLLAALKDENVAVRYSAAAALSKMRGEHTVEALIEALGDTNEFVRSSVAYALGTIGDKRAVAALLGKAADASEVVRFSVGKALGGLGSDEVLDELGKRLETATADVRRVLIDVVSQIKNDKAVGMLRKALRDEDAETSFKASLALMNVDDLSLLDDLIEASRRLDTELMSWLHEAGKGGKKPKTASSPGTRPTPRMPEDAARQFSSIFAGGAGSDSLEKLEAALAHESPNVRGCAANALGDFAGGEAGNLLIKALSDKHEYVRSSAVAALGKRRDEEAVPAILRLIQDPSDEVRYALAKAMANFGQKPEIIFALHKMADAENSRDVRRAARSSLERLKKESEEGTSDERS